MNVLITGATGFLGSHLTAAMARDKKYRVSIIARSTSKSSFPTELQKRIDVYKLTASYDNLPEIIQKAKPDVVIHLASLFLSAHRFDQISPLVEANVLFPTKLLDAMVQNKVKCFLNTGTMWEYYQGGKKYDPVNLYAATKKAFEDTLMYYVNAHGLKALTLKFYDTYGPRDNRPKLFHLLKRCLDTAERIEFSPGEQSLDLSYVDDIIEAYCAATRYLVSRKSSGHEEIPLGSGKSITLKKIVSVFEKCAGRDLNIAWGKRPYRPREVMRASASILEAKKKLGWKPNVGLEEGIKRLLEEGGEND